MQLIPVDFGAPGASTRYRSALEEGNILFFPRMPFELAAADRDFLMGVSAVGAARHKNVAYRPHINKVTGVGKTSPGDAQRLRSILSNYSQQVLKITGDLLPEYRAQWKVDYASFRSEEEQGRQLPWKKRNDLLHVDAFPSRPTNGDLILRVFSNINRSTSRVWLTSEPFEPLAERYALDAGLRAVRPAPLRPLRRLFGLPDRSRYDRFMLGFHDYLKQNQEYQQSTLKHRFEFPPESSWMVFTDVVPHAVLSGQYALEQTLIIARASLALPAKAPVSILESLGGAILTNNA